MQACSLLRAGLSAGGDWGAIIGFILGAKVSSRLLELHGNSQHVILEHGGSAPLKGSWRHVTLCHVAGLLLSLNPIICCPFHGSRAQSQGYKQHSRAWLVQLPLLT